MNKDKAELFSVGDRVRITTPDDASTRRFAPGTVGKVVRRFRDHYEIKAQGDFWYYSDHELGRL